MARTRGSQASLKRRLSPNIVVHNRQRDLPISSAEVRSLVRHLLKKMQVDCDEIIIQFVTMRAITKLHAIHFGDPTPTDTISFPIDPPGDKPHCLLGEIFVCPKTAILYAKKHRLDAYQETMLYLVHGFLHLLGYDDTTPQERRAMRKEEKRLLST